MTGVFPHIRYNICVNWGRPRRVAVEAAGQGALCVKGYADAGTEAQLRILRQGLAARRGGCSNLFLRVHLLRRVRRENAAQCLPQ